MTIKKGKLSREEQSARRQSIVEYIKANGPVKSSKLCADLNLSRSSLSDDINAINSQKSIILSPKKGWYEIDPSLGEASVRDSIDRQYVRRWYVLAMLSSDMLTFSELKEALGDLSISCSESTLRSDLQDLLSSGLVTSKVLGGELQYSSSVIMAADSRSIKNYRASRKSLSASPRMVISTYAGIDNKLMHAGAGELLSVRASSTRRSGKLNVISKEQMSALERFEQLPFKTNCLNITYHSNAGDTITVPFYTGLIVYSVETNRIYLLGRDDQQLNTVIPLDKVDIPAVVIPQEGNTVNRLYESPEFIQMYQEMLNISTNDPYDVRVRFQNLSFIREKIELLHSIRPQSEIEYVSDEEFLYIDRIRGINDFARFLRRFGRSAIVEEPEELRAQMISTSEKVIALYSEEEAENE